jgi:PAS domain S-box-containing protein
MQKLLSDLAVMFNPTGQSITIADAKKPGMPLIYANKGFENFSGYTREEAIGRNCKFLQGEHTEQAAIQVIRDTVSRRSSCIVDLINFKKNGDRFVNRLSLRPILGAEGELHFYIGIQSDITASADIEERIVRLIKAKLEAPFHRPVNIQTTTAAAQ